MNPYPTSRLVVLSAVAFMNVAFQAHVLSQSAPSTPDHKEPAQLQLGWERAAGGEQQFEAASIRPMPPGIDPAHPAERANFPLSDDGTYLAGPNDSLIADFPLVSYIQFAYKLRLTPDQLKIMLAHSPKWVSDQDYEIRAKASKPVSKDQLRLMVQALLADRFKLSLHFETKDASVLALTLDKPDKLGPNLRTHPDTVPCDQPDPKAFPPRCYISAVSMIGSNLIAGSRNSTIAEIAQILASISNLDHPIVDQTGLSGRYDFTLEWSPATGHPAELATDSPPNDAGVTFLEALHEQLGMRVLAARAPHKIPYRRQR